MGSIRIGWSTKNITPDKPVSLVGQFFERITTEVRDPLMVTVIAMESADGQEHVVWVSCDLLHTARCIQMDVREKAKSFIPGLNPDHIILSATHIHTGPVLSIDQLKPNLVFRTDNPDVLSPETYSEFVVGRIIEAIHEAWLGRQPGAVSMASGYAAISHNRRVIYDDGKGIMYGDARSAHFVKIGGPEDHRVELMYTWNDQAELEGVVVNAACTAQFLEYENYVSADLYGELRKQVREKWQKNIYILPIVGAAGDQSPRDLIRKPHLFTSDSTEDLEHAANVLVRTIHDGALASAKQIASAPVMKHTMQQIELPLRKVTRTEVEQASVGWKTFLAHAEQCGDLYKYFHTFDFDHQCEIFNQWATQYRMRRCETDPFYKMEFHTCRIGDAVLTTNPFELYTEFGLQIKARSKAKFTFIAQLSCDHAGYLPTAEAIATGGYSTQVFSGIIGDDGGRLLVEHTLKAIDALGFESM